MPGRGRSVFLIGPEQLEIREVQIPEPGDGELVVRIDAATTCGTDVKVFQRGGHPRMLRAPSPFGHEMAGTVVARGRGAEGWKDGDRVVVSNSVPCRACRYCEAGRENLCPDLQYLNGAFADYLVVPRRFAAAGTYALPRDLDPRRAALTEPLACVLHGIETAGLPVPSDIAVLGAGPIGLLFVAVLTDRGHRVAVADPHPQRLAIAHSLGAAATLRTDRREDAEAVGALAAAAEGFDVAIDATGSPGGWKTAVGSVGPGGLALLFGGCPPGSHLALDTERVHYGELTLRGAYHHRPATMAEALNLLAAGLEVEPLLSEERPLAGTEEALRRMMRREVLKVVIRP